LYTFVYINLNRLYTNVYKLSIKHNAFMLQHMLDNRVNVSKWRLDE